MGRFVIGLVLCQITSQLRHKGSAVSLRLKPLAKIMEYYEQAAEVRLADEFYREFKRMVDSATDRPRSFAIRKGEIRRVNLRRFPFHFLFRVKGDAMRVLVVRHHRRDPSFGMSRR